MKPTKANVEKMCKRLGVKFERDESDVTIAAPNGYHFVADVCGYHYCTFPVDGKWTGYTMPEIYELMLEQLAEGIEKCEPGCECLWDEENGNTTGESWHEND